MADENIKVPTYNIPQENSDPKTVDVESVPTTATRDLEPKISEENVTSNKK